ncbi:MAG TPA: hypothetical protein VFV58_03470 [Blastocatellia bacterium]|jgi:hypothetical protein|nr:hypothetical protein [Blastocatellia bacterium]
MLIPTLGLASWRVFPPRAPGQGQRADQEQQRPDAIKVNTALVTAPVVVTDRYGQFVTGLSQNDFRLQENGEPKQIASFSSTEAPFNVTLLIDTSRSAKNKIGAIRNVIASEYLRAFAAQSGALNFRAEGIESSSFAFALIANELRHQYTLSYYPTNDKHDGGFRTIAVSVKGCDFSVRARQGYRAPKDEKVEEKDQNKKPGN